MATLEQYAEVVRKEKFQAAETNRFFAEHWMDQCAKGGSVWDHFFLHKYDLYNYYKEWMAANTDYEPLIPTEFYEEFPKRGYEVKGTKIYSDVPVIRTDGTMLPCRMPTYIKKQGGEEYLLKLYGFVKD